MGTTGRWQARRLGVEGRAQPWAQALDRGRWQDCARVLKEDGRVRVLAARLCGRDVVLKFYRHRSWTDRLRARLGLAAADRHWAGAALLAAEGFRCAPMLALLSRSLGSQREDCLVMGRLEGQTLLHWLAEQRQAEAPPARQHAVARAVGAQVGCMLAAGLHNRDHKPSNLILSWEGSSPVVSVADCQGVHRLTRDRARHALRMQASLALEAIGAGVLPRRTLLAMTLSSVVAAYTLRRFGKVALQDALGLDRRRRKEALAALPRGTALGAWRRIAQRIAHHGDPTPRVDPLLAARPIAP